MANHQALEVQHGIWIDERRLKDAGLGSQIQIIVQPGEIRIVTAPEDTQQPKSSKDEEIWTEETWEVLQSLGQDAEPGKLHNPSENHDRYLYDEWQK